MSKDPKISNSGLNFGYTIIGEFLFCFFVGFVADQKLQSGYTWTMVGIGCAVVLIGYEVWKLSRNNL